MTNSIIINAILKLFNRLAISYKHSKFHELFMKLDNSLKNSALNSLFVKIFTKSYNAKFVSNSIFYKLTESFYRVIKTPNPILKRWIINSKIVRTTKDIIWLTISKPFRTIGLIGIGFFSSNIIFNIISRTINFKLLFIKFILLVIFFIISTIKISTRNLFGYSKFYEIFKWTIRNEN